MPWEPAHGEAVVSGWGPMPRLEAPNIGPLVEGILKNRLGEQVNLQNQMSNLAKQIQAQRQNEAFGEQASNAGLLPGVDTSGMSAAQTALLAKLVQGQGSEATMNAYRQALGGAVTTRANAYAADKAGGGDDGSGAPTAPETYTDPNTGLQWARGPAGRWTLVPRYGQRGSATDPTGQNAPSLEPQIITPDGGSAAPNTPQPDITPTPIPYDQTIPTGPTRVPPNSAQVQPGAPGTWPVSDQDQQALVWAQGHPDDPRAAAIFQRLGMQ